MGRAGFLIAMLVTAWSFAAQPALACRELVVFPWLDDAHEAIVLVQITEARPLEPHGLWNWEVVGQPVRTLAGMEQSEPLHFSVTTGTTGCPRTPPSGLWVAYMAADGGINSLSLIDARRFDPSLIQTESEHLEKE